MRLPVELSTFQRSIVNGFRAYGNSSDPRSRLLDKALPYVKTHGFSLEAFKEAEIQTQTAQALFPCSHTLTSSLLSRRQSVNGPAYALFLHWSRYQTKTALEMESRDDQSPAALLRKRLALNCPVMPQLRELLRPSPSPQTTYPSILQKSIHFLHESLRVKAPPYRQHIQTLADDVCWNVYAGVQGEEWYGKRARIASVYAAAELYQLQDDSFDYRAIYKTLDTLLDKADNLSSAFRETALFANYVGTSWQSILRSRYL